MKTMKKFKRRRKNAKPMTLFDDKTQQEIPIEAAPEPAPRTEAEVVVLDNIGRKIDANLAGLYITTKRPAARPMLKEVKIEATTTSNDQQQVNNDNVTNPCWKIDIHPLWAEIDANKAKIDKVLDKYSVSASVKGEHLVSMLKIGELMKELNALRQERLALAHQLALRWESEAIPGIRAAFPQWFDNQIKDRLPAPSTLVDRFDVYWVVRPLTPMDSNKLDLSALNEADAQEVLKRNQEFIQKLAEQRFQTIFDNVFGELMKLCDDINTGAFKFGKRRGGALDEIFTMLERVSNFSMFADEATMTSVKHATETIKKYNIQDLNSSEAAQLAFKKAMAPIGEALKKLSEQQVGTGRAARSVEI